MQDADGSWVNSATTGKTKTDSGTSKTDTTKTVFKAVTPSNDQVKVTFGMTLAGFTATDFSKGSKVYTATVATLAEQLSVKKEMVHVVSVEGAGDKRQETCARSKGEKVAKLCHFKCGG